MLNAMRHADHSPGVFMLDFNLSYSERSFLHIHDRCIDYDHDVCDLCRLSIAGSESSYDQEGKLCRSRGRSNTQKSFMMHSKKGKSNSSCIQTGVSRFAWDCASRLFLLLTYKPFKPNAPSDRTQIPDKRGSNTVVGECSCPCIQAAFALTLFDPLEGLYCRVRI